MTRANCAVVNKKNKRKRQGITLDRKAHRRLKIMAVKSDVKLETLIDEAAFSFLKNPGMNAIDYYK